MDHGATALKDGKYLEAKDIANEVLQKKKDDALEKAVTSNAENMLQKAKDVEEKVNERVAKRRKVEEEGRGGRRGGYCHLHLNGLHSHRRTLAENSGTKMPMKATPMPSRAIISPLDHEFAGLDSVGAASVIDIRVRR